MKPANESVQWDCAECGCRNGAMFGTASFVCPACGYEAFDDDLRQTYRSVREGLFRRPEFSGFNRSAFQSDSVPKSAKTLLQNACPFLAPLRRWSDLTLLDLLWILRAAPDAVAVLPLTTIGRSFWNAIEKATDDPTASFAAALGNGKANAASVLVREGNAADLRRQERLLTVFGWSRWTDPEREKIARNLLDSVLRTSNKQTIREFSPETQLNLWRTDPARSGIDVAPLVPSLSPSDLVFALGRGIIKPDVLESAFFNRWTPKDWLALLRLPGLVLPEKAKIEIDSRWNELGWSAGTLAELVAENPNARRAFPVLSSGTTADLLLKHPEFSSWMATDGWLNRIATQDWLRLLSKEEVLLKTEVLDYARRSVLPGLSDSDRDRLIENNLDIAAFYPLDTLPEKTIVDLYVAGRHDACFDGFDFSSLSRSGWLSLLSRCGERVPPAAAGFFLKEGVGLDTATVEPLLSGNPALLPFFSEKQISRLSTEAFLRLCKRSGAPDFLVSAYPVKTWTHESQEEFLARYPWTEKYFDWTSWPIWTIDRITKNNRMLEESYPRRGRLFLYRHWKWLSGIAAAVLLSLGLLASSATAPLRRDIQLSRERKENKWNEARIAEANYAARKSEALTAEANAQSAQNAAKRAEDERVAQLSRERETKIKLEAEIAENRRVTAEAEKKKAEDDVLIERSRAVRAKRELEIQQSKERESVAENERLAKDAEARKVATDLELAKAETAREKASFEAAKAREAEHEAARRNDQTLNDATAALQRGKVTEARKLLEQLDGTKIKEKDRYLTLQEFADKLSQAQDNNPEAQLWIGKKYANGIGPVVPRIDTKAVEWFKKAAKGGNVEAMRSLGVMYKSGRGVKRDVNEAARWYEKAYDKNDWQAGTYLGRLYYDGAIGGWADYGKAVKILKNCAEHKNPDALYYLGECMYFGRGCRQSRDGAIRAIKTAKESGSKLTHMDWIIKRNESSVQDSIEYDVDPIDEVDDGYVGDDDDLSDILSLPGKVR